MSVNMMEPIPFSQQGIQARIKRLGMIYQKINDIPEDVENPILLARKVRLYNEAQGIIGDLYSQSVYDHGIAYAHRKEQQGLYEMAYIGTAKDKEGYAEQRIVELRRAETRAEAEMRRWEKAYNHHEQLANAIKHELGVVQDDLRAGGRSQ